ncbi:MAG: epoxyqueuosine reductase QueH [Eubacterium sp.]|nr:epoxyqueuosine reductase QueH [Eubacterium sp.]
MNKINYSIQTEKIIENNKREQIMPSLLLHACCAPCSSACLEYLNKHFKITVFYYNPNISPKEEFDKRLKEEKRLVSEMLPNSEIDVIEGEYNYNDFLETVKGLEDVPEGGERCFKCYRLRLEKTARLAKEMGFDYFCTTLSISPLKNSQKINEIGLEVAEKYGVKWLPSDFKKKEGYKRSIELSKQYGLYRQNFCGCVFSEKEENENE